MIRKVNSGIGIVGVVVVALANLSTTWAQSDEVPRRLRERISRTLIDKGFPSAASAFDTEVKITASDGAAGDSFGWSVSISGDTAIAGAYGDQDEGEWSGSACVYQRDKDGVDNKEKWKFKNGKREQLTIKWKESAGYNAARDATFPEGIGGLRHRQRSSSKVLSSRERG